MLTRPKLLKNEVVVPEEEGVESTWDNLLLLLLPIALRSFQFGLGFFTWDNHCNIRWCLLMQFGDLCVYYSL